jgi:hypothetical protein
MTDREIIEALAKCNPVLWVESGPRGTNKRHTYECALCQQLNPEDPHAIQHGRGCPWLMAKLAVEAKPATGGGG